MSIYQIQPAMGGPFVIALVHFTDENGNLVSEKEDTRRKGKGKGKGKEKAQPEEEPAPKQPTSMVGLIASPLPQSADKTGNVNLSLSLPSLLIV